MALHSSGRAGRVWNNGATIITNSHSSNSRDSDQVGTGVRQVIIICYYHLEGEEDGRQEAAENLQPPALLQLPKHALAGSQELYAESHATCASPTDYKLSD